MLLFAAAVVRTGNSGNWGSPKIWVNTSVGGLLIFVKIRQTNQEFKKKQIFTLNGTIFGILHFIKVFTKYKAPT